MTMDKLNSLLSDSDQKNEIISKIQENPQLQNMISNAGQNPEQLKGIVGQVQGALGGGGGAGGSDTGDESTLDPSNPSASAKKKDESGAWAPRRIGEGTGDKIESVLGPVGKPLGKGLGAVGQPVGGVIDPLLGGLMRSGGAFGNALGTGAGNMEHKKRAEEEEKKPFGGQEQSGDNPLGL